MSPDELARELAEQVRVDPEVATLTEAMVKYLPPHLVELAIHDYACAIRRATVAAMLERSGTMALD
jgi:hypothetical protein